MRLSSNKNLDEEMIWDIMSYITQVLSHTNSNYHDETTTLKTPNTELKTR